MLEILSGEIMVVPVVGIDVSKDRLDVSTVVRAEPRGHQVANSPEGWRALIAWLEQHEIKRVRACMEATARHSFGVALVLYEAGHIVGFVNPAQMRDFYRAKLHGNETNEVNAALIHDFAALFPPPAWSPPSPAQHRLCALRIVQVGFLTSRVEWQDRLGNGVADLIACELVRTTIAHLDTQIAAVEKAIAETIEHGDDL